ncbi:MAG: ketose-bisphosphate aldolase [Lachnospiraceae bacterium]|jgi:fructose-bisphosphate aldolase class II|nr:ketose-bisphosphate aldolase [Lachnospiraceae bacterium]
MLLNMTDLLKVANEHSFAVPAFNIGTGMILNGVIETCEKLKAPVILAIHPWELEFNGDAFLQMVLERAHRTKLPVCIHLDHSEWGPITRAIRAGFTSVMIDASSKPFEENIEITRKVVELAHPLGVSVEGELGSIGTTDGENVTSESDILYTKPEDAAKFVKETGVDCLAIAIGTSHGIYPKGLQPKLKQDLLSEIKKAIPNTPLVLHGGSGNKDEEIAEAVRRGVNKINISSDIKDAFYQRLRITLEDKKIREPFELYPDSIKAMNKVVEEKVRLFNDDDKLKYYVLDEMI